MEAGKRYRIRYKKYGGRQMLEAVLDFLWYDKDGSTAWSARPLYGTQHFDKGEPIDVEEVPKDMKIYMNRRVRVRA